MKIIQYGTVILTEGPVKVEGWTIEREPSDPMNATEEQLLLDFAITWAKARLAAAVTSTVLAEARKMAHQKLLAASLPKITSGMPPTCSQHSEQMVLNVYNRPGGPPGNSWVCRSCIAERASRNPSQDDLKKAGHVQYYGQVGTNPNPCTCAFCQTESGWDGRNGVVRNDA